MLVHVGWRPDGTDAIKTRAQVPRPAGGVPPEFMEFVEELKVDAARDIVIQKRQWGAFYGTDLDLQLRRRGVTNIVLCGIATSIGVESTARDAWERSYNLTFATDAMTDRDEGAHTRSLEVIFPPSANSARPARSSQSCSGDAPHPSADYDNLTAEQRRRERARDSRKLTPRPRGGRF